MAELLLEILSEEIPARMQARAADDLKRLVTAALKDAGLEFANAEAYVTPRRLTLVVDGLPERQPDIREEKRGPQVGAPEKAVSGFLKSVGLTPDQCEQREIKGKSYYFAVIEKQGRATGEVLAEIIGETLGALPWPKSMRWGEEELISVALLTEDGSTLRTEDGGKILLDIAPPRWVRPIHSILCLFAGDVVPISFARIEAKDTTRGHRFMAPEPITVADFADYQAKLKKAKVVLDGAERAQMIKAGAERLAAAEGLKLRDDPALLAEVAGLVEWPVPLIGAIDPEFMEVPAEVLTESMRAHQKYFALETKDGRLAPRFVMVANTETRDGGAAVVAGNERVLRARLSDARFFWDQDCRQTLESRVDKLETIVFHKRVGSLGEKAGRIMALASELCRFIPGADRDLVCIAANLCKADLTTGMVGEFPELQGVMGRYYALHDKERPEVADAIAEHYSPKGPSDICPTAPTSVAVALADRIDTLVALFGIGEKPTGSRDPFALRRAALGVIRLIVENDIRLPLAEAFKKAEYEIHMPVVAEITEEDRGAFNIDELLPFFAERLKVRMRAHGVRHDLIAAAFAVDKPGGGLEDDLVRLLARVEALTAFLESDDGADLLTAYKRAANIVAIEEKKDKQSYDGEADPKLFAQDEETALHAGLGAAMKASSVALEGEDFTAVMAELAKLRAPVDAFFDEVTVNCDDEKLRRNRLRLLSQIRATLGNVADFSRIEG